MSVSLPGRSLSRLSDSQLQVDSPWQLEPDSGLTYEALRLGPAASHCNLNNGNQRRADHRDQRHTQVTATGLHRANVAFWWSSALRFIGKLPIAKTLRNLRNPAKRKNYLRNLAKFVFASPCENSYLRNLANLTKQM